MTAIREAYELKRARRDLQNHLASPPQEGTAR